MDEAARAWDTHRMKRASAALPLLLAAGLAGVLAASPRRGAASPAPAERGRYLVDGVAMCSECHTPRDARGLPDPSRYLQGAPIWITPVEERPDWANRAPALAGLESYTDEQAESVLERGVGPNGLP